MVGRLSIPHASTNVYNRYFKKRTPQKKVSCATLYKPIVVFFFFATKFTIWWGKKL